MLTSLRIQNFRSIRDASVKLGQVNLFIGPNNSGKSNFLKGVELAADAIHQRRVFDDSEFDKVVKKGIVNHTDGEVHPALAGKFGVEITAEFHFYFADVFPTSTFFLNPQGKHKVESITRFKDEQTHQAFKQESVVNQNKLDGTSDLLKNTLKDCVIYKPDPAQFQKGAAISNEAGVSADASNLVAYLFYLSQNHKARFRQLEHDLAQCVGNLVSISTPADPAEPGKLKLKFFDQNDVGYWAEEVSEGVLYFLALLCIVHQPDPPKLLLLEEPEKGIHPRRIKEVMNFIFELARLRDIQIILTSHSPYVVDHFKDIPHCVSVFDRDPETGETIIHNAKDLIDKTNAEYALEGLPPTDYTSSLGEYWVSGFLGGVPL